MDDKVSVIFKKPYENPIEMQVEDKLSNWQQLVEGYIEVIRFNGRIYIVLNEEGKLQQLPLNMPFYNDILVGNLVFVATNDEGEFVSLTEEEKNEVLKFIG